MSKQVAFYYSGSSVGEAQHILEHNGIIVEVVSTTLGYGNHADGYRLLVSEAQEAKARKLLAKHRKAIRQAGVGEKKSITKEQRLVGLLIYGSLIIMVGVFMWGIYLITTNPRLPHS